MICPAPATLHMDAAGLESKAPPDEPDNLIGNLQHFMLVFYVAVHFYKRRIFTCCASPERLDLTLDRMIFLTGTIFRKKESKMLTIVFIKRHMQAGAEKEFFSLIKKLRSNAMEHDGYISGETLVSTDNPQELLVISRWQSREDWADWKESEARKATDTSLEKLQTTPTQYKSYVFSKFRLSVQSGFPKSEGKS